MDALVRQIRMARYFPENFDTPGTGNDIPVANQNPIQFGTSAALAIYGAATGCLDADGIGVCDDPQPSRAEPGLPPFGMKGHFGVDSRSKLIHSVEASDGRPSAWSANLRTSSTRTSWFCSSVLTRAQAARFIARSCQCRRGTWRSHPCRDPSEPREDAR